MASAAPSSGQLVLYILLPIVSFTTIVIVVYYCYRRRKCCFSTNEEALLGNTEKKRFTVDMGKRRRRNSSINSNSWDSFDSAYPSKSQDFQPSGNASKSHHTNNNSKRTGGPTIIPTAVPRPDIKKSLVVGQARDNNNLLPGSYQTPRRATSPAQSLPDYTSEAPIHSASTNELYHRHHSYDASFSKRRVSENLAYSTISENDIPGSFKDGGISPIKLAGSGDNLNKSPSSPRRLRHQGRVKGKADEPSFSRPITQPRVSLIISAVESLDLESSDESEPEFVDTGRRKQLYSPSTSVVQQKRSNSKGELQPGRARRSSSSSDRDPRKSPSVQYSGRSSPALLQAVHEESTFAPRSPATRSRSSPVESQQTSLDMHALQAALSQHRRSEGEVLGNVHRNEVEDVGHFRPEGLQRRERAVSQSSIPGGRRTGAGKTSPDSSTSSLSVGKESYPGKQGRRRSSMQMPIDLNQINPKLYEDLIKLPSVDLEEPDVEGPQIHFALDYNMDLEILTVKLIQARNLQTQAFSGTCDPYCTTALLPGFNARQSKVHRRTTDPEFEEKFTFGIKQEDMRFKTLEIRTYDFDQFSRDECTGVMEMKMDVFDFGLTNHYDLWKKFRLQDLKSSESVETCGDLMLALSYLPSAEKLTVAIQKARNLKSPEGRKGPPDAYIKVSIFRGGQRLKKKKTDTVQGTYNPVFNQALTFSVSPDLLQCPILRITCQAVHDQKLAANAELGYLVIGPGSKCEEEIKHWRDVVGKHSNKPVARWHKMLPPEVVPDESRGSFLNLANVRRSSSSVLYPANDRVESGRISPGTRRSLT